MNIFYNPGRPTPPALAFHRRLPGYAPTPVVDAPILAARLGVGRLSLKLETNRLGLPSFKILGASYATYRALCARLGDEPEWATLDDLRAAVDRLRPLTLLAATDGNHGRAVARMAALLGLRARIFVPADMAPARVAAISGEGAEVVAVDGSYDDAVALSAAAAGPEALVISDTAWPGYEQTPRNVIAGYATIFQEADAALGGRPDLLAVQMGVGALAAAVIGHYRQGADGPVVVGVEPDQAACVLASLRAGEITEVPGPHRSIMAGLNCGLPSPLAWPIISAGLDAALAVPDELAREAMRALAAEGVVAGETGAAGVAGLLALCADAEARTRLGIGPNTHAMAIITEGATDPDAYKDIVGMPITITPERPDTPDATALVIELDELLIPMYPADSHHGLDVRSLIAEGVAFFVLRVDGAPAGCGGVKIYPEGYAEVKRMFVRPQFRGLGLSKRMLSHLEDYTRAQGLSILRLETGTLQHEAIALYERMGFTEIPPFGPYRYDPHSLCFEKHVG